MGHIFLEEAGHHAIQTKNGAYGLCSERGDGATSKTFRQEKTFGRYLERLWTNSGRRNGDGKG
jgi:hypothetical protein